MRHSVSKWISAPGHPDEIMLIAGSEARFYNWEDLSDSTIMPPIHLNCGQKAFSEELDLKRLINTGNGKCLIADFRRSHGDKSTAQVAIWDMATALGGSAGNEITTSSLYKNLSGNIRCVLGVNGSRLVFLDRGLWVCSVDLGYTRHFFVTNDFLGGDVGVLGLITSERYVVFAKDGELAVLMGGMEFEDIVRLEKD